MIQRIGSMREMPTSPMRPEPSATQRPSDPVSRAATRASGRLTSVVLVLSVAAIAALALLVPSTPLLGLLLVAAILGGVVAILVRHGRRERDEAALLEDLSTVGYVVLRDRAAPGFAGTVRRLVIGPAGVFLVEMVEVTGRVRVRGSAVVVGGRSLALGPRVQGQSRAVAAALAPQLAGAGAHVTPFICMRRAELPLLRRRVAGIPLLREAAVVRRIAAAPSVMDEATVAWVADLARSTMPPVGRAPQDEEPGDPTRPRSRRVGLARTRPAPAGDASEPLSEAPSPA